MKNQRKTYSKDLQESLRKMELNLKDENSSKNSPLTVGESKFPTLRDLECSLGYLKLTLLEDENNMKNDEARFGKVAAEERKEGLARMWQHYAELEESLRVIQEHYESILQR